jgi:hypothetical protein
MYGEKRLLAAFIATMREVPRRIQEEDDDRTILFLPLPARLREINESQRISALEQCACCPDGEKPSCGPLDATTHRTVLEGLCAGRNVVLRLRVCICVCRVPTCLRKVVAKRLPALVHSWGRDSHRLWGSLQALEFSTSADADPSAGPTHEGISPLAVPENHSRPTPGEFTG